MLRKLNKNRGGFTLVEIMIVVAIIALLAAIAVPGFLRARKRSQASRVVNDLRLIDSAVDQYAIENNKTTGTAVGTNDWIVYMKKGSSLYNTGADLYGNGYGHADGRRAAESSGNHLEYSVGRCRHRILLALRSLLGADSYTCHPRSNSRVAGNELATSASRLC